MPQARIEMGMGTRGPTLSAIGRELRNMDNQTVTRIFRDALEGAAKPFPFAVRASAYAIPVKGPKHTGLRARIALCATLSSGTDSRSAWVSLWIDPKKMVPDYKTLPLYMEGVTPKYARWRHPVYGRWLAGQRDQPSHPYFRQAAEPLGEAARAALEAALNDITRRISG